MQEFISHGAISTLPDCVKKADGKNILVVHGKKSYQTSGLKEAIENSLITSFIEWDNFESNPKWENLEEGLKLVRSNKVDLIIAAGGGSVIDTAKLLSIFAPNPVSLEDALEKGFPKSALPLIAIPSTAGTGSEATQFAVVWKAGKKYSIDTPSLLPICAIVDPSFIKNQSEATAAAPLADALAQAIESYWCINSTEKSKEYAAEAIKMIVPTIHRGELADEDYLARAKGAFLAGKAINITRTTAAHAVSYAFTALKGVAHGHAVMLTLPNFFIFNSELTEAECLDKRGADYVKDTIKELCKFLGADSVIGASETLYNFMHILGLEKDLGKLEITSETDFQYIIDNGFNPQRVKNNPRPLTESALRAILAGGR